MKPPIVRFITKIYHPNIDTNGQVCVDYLQDSWSSLLKIESVLISIASLLADPSADDPIVPEIASTLVSNPDLYDQNARLYPQRIAQRVMPSCESITQAMDFAEEAAERRPTQRTAIPVIETLRTRSKPNLQHTTTCYSPDAFETAAIRLLRRQLSENSNRPDVIERAAIRLEHRELSGNNSLNLTFSPTIFALQGRPPPFLFTTRSLQSIEKSWLCRCKL